MNQQLTPNTYYMQDPAHTDTYLIYGPTDPPAGTSNLNCDHFGSGRWLTMPPATTTLNIGELYATEHILEKALIKKFFEYLVKQGENFPQPLKGSKLGKVKACGFIKRYWEEPSAIKAVATSPLVIPEWMFLKPTGTGITKCMTYTLTRWLGNIWPGNNIAFQDESLFFN